MLMQHANLPQLSAASSGVKYTISPPDTPSVTLLRALLLGLAFSIAMTLFLVPTAEGVVSEHVPPSVIHRPT